MNTISPIAYLIYLPAGQAGFKCFSKIYK